MQDDNVVHAIDDGFAQDLQQVRDAFEIMNNRAGDIGELVEPDQLIAAITLAQIIMTALPIPGMDRGKLNRGQKSYWMEVADHMGPDFIGELRRVAAFMAKVHGQ